MTNIFNKLMEEKSSLVVDGAMGTSLFKKGLETGDCPELLNRDNAGIIKEVHTDFINAGADIILTNSFGGTKFRFKLHKIEDQVEELNYLAAKIAKEAVMESGKEVVVAGSMGPSGELLIPLGILTEEDALEGFYEQAEALKKGGADVLWIETMSSIEEASIAVKAALKTGLPVINTMTFDTAGKTMMGLSPEDFSSKHPLIERVSVIGANCGVGPEEALISLYKMMQKNKNVHYVIKANCGVPEFKNGEFVYSGTPELMEKYGVVARSMGIKIIGGCCGTGADILKNIADGVNSDTNVSINSEEDIKSYLS